MSVTIKTDKKLIEAFLKRGVEKIYPSEQALRKKLLAGERMKIYQGFDPTGPYLHIGHAMGIRALSILQKLGHQVVFLVGDYTAKVGDPDKDTTRKILTDEEIEKNMEGWKEQAGQLIEFEGENAVQFERNSSWLSKLKLEDIIHLMSRVTVQKMAERDLFKRRLKKGDPIQLQEFIYPLMQGYDGVAMKVDMEIGGADQIFNMLMGRTLSKSYLKKEKFIRANKMMDAPDRITMSKTKGNGINLSDTSKDMYGKAMSYPDQSILAGFELLTEIPIKEIEEMKRAMEKGENPMQFKKLMALEIVKMIKGEKEAQEAEQFFYQQFQKKDSAEKEYQTINLTELNLPSENLALVDLLLALKVSDSKGGCRRLIEQGGISVNNERITDINYTISNFNKEILIKAGKRGFYRVKR
ncbi:MAG: tyrosine--tRNA ligase [Patescibacteria group bacterium]|nr:tyrosine--tRNA ligase [Patescibacteria group bacterium]